MNADGIESNVSYTKLAIFSFSAYIILHYLLIALSFGDYTTSPIDELTCLLLAPAAVSCAGTKKYRAAAYCFLGYVLFLIVSAEKNNIGGVSQPISAIVAGILDAKLPFMIFGIGYIYCKIKNAEKFICILSLVFVVIAVIDSPFYILDYIRGVSIWGKVLIHKGVLVQPVGLFSHQTETALLYSYSSISGLLLYRIYKNTKFLWLGIVFFLFTIFTVSVKEVFGVIIAFYVLFQHKDMNIYQVVLKSLLPTLLFTAVLMISPVGDAVMGHIGMFYGVNAIPTVRLAMTLACLPIAYQYFPFGSGGGTFGSASSVAPYGYSNLYYSYGINYLNGGSPDNQSFLMDVFWPKVIAEAGVIGTLLYVGFILIAARGLFTKSINLSYKEDAVKRYCIAIFLCNFLNSLASASFTSELVIFTTGIALGYSIYLSIGRNTADRSSMGCNEPSVSP